MKIDLHAHTTHSDGQFTPAALAEESAKRGVSVQAVTDHDTVGGVEAVRAAAPTGLRIVWGVELSTRDAGGDVHVLGFFAEKPPTPFLALLETQRSSRRRRAQAMMDLLKTLGKPLTWEDIKAAGAGEDSVGRPHVARAMVAKGYSRTVSEVFRRWIGPGMPAFVAHQVPTPEEGVRAIREAGGVPSIAHPGRLKDPTTIERAIAAGLLGLEVIHPDHRPEQVAALSELALRHGLISTGGSDFHGLPGERFAKLGDFPTPEKEFAKIEAAWS